MTLEPANQKEYKAVKSLYHTAFPREERAPFFLMKRSVKKGAANLLVARKEGGLVGFVYLVCARDLVYLFYFAVEEQQRGKGNGGRILQLLKERYKGKRLFLAREQLDETAANYGQRVRRHAFYQKNGFEDLPCQIREASVIYDVMGIGGSILPEEYNELMLRWGGRIVKRMVRMELLTQSNKKGFL